MSITHTSSRCALLATVSFWLFFQAPAAHAYFDPASGSLVLQMIIGGIAGVAFIVRLYWHKLLGLFGIETRDPSADEDEGNVDDGRDEDEGTVDEDDDQTTH